MKLKNRFKNFLKIIAGIIGFRDVLILLGMGMLFYGTYIIFAPAAFILIGIILFISGAGFINTKR